MGGVPLFPDQASTAAGQVDAIYFVLIGLSALFAIPIAGLLLYFGVKYRRGSNADRHMGHISGFMVELPLIGLMLVLAIGVYTWAASVYFHIERPPADAVQVYVVGKQWMWKLQHPEGQREINELHVPIGRPIQLIMTSEDVIHSFYVPAFRIKQDVLPGRYTTIWFQATKVGEYRLHCAEYCGTDHAVMGGRIIVMDQTAYQAWLSGGTAAGGQPPPQSMAQSGERLFMSLGCSGCHRMDGSGVAPSLVGVFGKPVPLQGGGTTTADEGYIRDSILLPQKQVVAGYPPIMPSFQGQASEEQLLELIAYIKSLGQAQSQPGAPAAPGGQGAPATQTTQGTQP